MQTKLTVPAWDLLKMMIQRNMLHRKGKRLNEMTMDNLLRYTFHEAAEMSESLTNDKVDLMEIADTIGVLYHIAQRCGFTYQELDDAIIHKYNTRFSE